MDYFTMVVSKEEMFEYFSQSHCLKEQYCDLLEQSRKVPLWQSVCNFLQWYRYIFQVKYLNKVSL